MCVVVDQGGELYALLVDQVGEVLSLGAETAERNPPTLDRSGARFSAASIAWTRRLLVVLDVARVLDFSARAEAA